MNKANDFWENCDTTFAHLTPDKWLNSKESLVNSFKRHHGPFDLRNKVVVDYGIGGAFQGIYLFENLDVKKYIGIDIAKRSLEAARKNLKKYDQDKIELHLTPVDFSKLEADVFTSFAVMQHFPSEEYLNDFLDNLNNSKIPELILQIRYSETNAFSRSYDTQDDVCFACRTNKEYLLSKLTRYSCIQESKIHDSGYQYLYFTLQS